MDAEVRMADFNKATRSAGVLVSIVVAVAFSLSACKSNSKSKESDPTPANRTDAAVGKPEIDRAKARANAYRVIRESLRESMPQVRAQACDATGKAEDHASIATLTGLVQTDPSHVVRGHAASALATLRAGSAVPLLDKLKTSAPPGLAVWFADALARLGNKDARKQLLGFAQKKDVAVSFRACLALANLARAGDKQVIGALRRLAAREAELNKIAPYAGAVILTKLARLKFAAARDMLYKLLEQKDAGTRSAAAEGLAKLGDEAGRRVLRQILGDASSPYRTAAAVALVSLGDYTGSSLLKKQLGAKTANERKLAARGVGEIGDGGSLGELIEMLGDKDKTVRLAAAVAILAIVQLDYATLTKKSVDWAKAALGSEDWAVRYAAATTVGDLPKKKVVPLLAQAIADKNPKVRRAATISAARLEHNKQAATTVAAALIKEKDKQVREVQVRALGRIGHADAASTLETIAHSKTRLGIMALGALVALNKLTAVDKLRAAFASHNAGLRLAVMDAAHLAGHRLVVPLLSRGLHDNDARVQFSAAVASAYHKANKAAALPVLQKAVTSKDKSVAGRARAALIRFGETPPGPTISELLDSPDVDVRRATVEALVAMEWSMARPLLSRAIRDPDEQTRRAAVDAIAEHRTAPKNERIAAYKSLLHHEDPVCRTKAQAQLAKLLGGEAPAPDSSASGGTDPTVIKRSIGLVNVARTELDTVVKKLNVRIDALQPMLRNADPSDQHVDRVERNGKALAPLIAAVGAASNKLESAAKTFAALAAGKPPAELADTIKRTRESIAKATKRGAKARTRGRSAARASRAYVQKNTANATMTLSAATSALGVNKLAEARRNLAKARQIMRRLGKTDPLLYYLYGELYEKTGMAARGERAKLRQFKRARANYARYVRTGKDFRVGIARRKSAELAKKIAKLATK